MTQRCSATNYSRICPQRHTCELYRRHVKYMETGVGLFDNTQSMPVSAGDGCYMYEPAGIREAVRKVEENRK